MNQSPGVLNFRGTTHAKILRNAHVKISRDISIFAMPTGNMRPKRFIFDAKSSQDISNGAIGKIFGTYHTD